MFGTNPTSPVTFPGIPDAWIKAHFTTALGFDPNGDPDGDRITNTQENQLGLNPNHFDKTGPVNLGFDEEITESPDMSFRETTYAYPSDLYDQSSIPGWKENSSEGIEGWQANTGSHIEIWDENIAVSSAQQQSEGGAQASPPALPSPYVELQSHMGSHGIKQEFNMLPGTRLNFILRYKGRYEYDPYTNAFDLKVEGASELLVDGAPAGTTGTTRSKVFMDDDEWQKYTDWRHAFVSITAEAGSSGLKKITLLLVPKTTTRLGENGEEEMTYGGFVDLIPVEITVAFGLGPEALGPKTSRELLETYLETVKVSRTGDTWFVKSTDAQGVEKFHGVEIITTKEKLIDALKRSGQKVVFDGHSNFGLGPNLSDKVTHKTIADFTHFGVGKTSIPKSFRGDGTETDVVPFTNGDGTTLPTNPQDLAAIDRVYSEGWAYLKLGPGQIIEAPQNYQITELGIERFKNLQGVAPGSTFTKQGNGFSNEWHFDSPEGSRRLIVQAPSTDVPTLGYAKFFYNACNTGRDYIESFKHGDFIYTKDSCRVEKATTIFVQGIIEGKSNDQIMTDLNQDGVGSSGNPPPQIYEYKTF